MKTISNRILVTHVETKTTKNELGLTLPDYYDVQGLEKVKVIYSGSDYSYIKPDQELLIYKGSGTKVKEGNVEYKVISITDIVIIYE